MQIESKIDAARRLLDAGAAAGALQVLEEALEHEPRQARALNLKAFALAADARHDEALKAHADAAAAAPHDAALRQDYAEALIAAGEFDAGESELREVLKIDPESAEVLGALAWMRRVRPDDPLIDRLIALKTKAGAGALRYAKYCYALGKCYDDIGEFDLAFANVREANALRNVACSADANDAVFRDIKAAWSAALFASFGRRGCESRKPIFIVGIPRSGSTLLESRLAGVAGVKSLGESGEIIRIAATLTKHHPRRARYPDWLEDLPAGAFADLGRLYVEKFERRHPDAMRFVDKSLMNFAYVGMISAMLPNSLVIDCRRDPLDACLSCYFHDLNVGHSYSFDLANLGRFYRGYVALMEHWRAHVDNLATVQYEAFVETPDEHVAWLHERMGLGRHADAGGAGPRHVKTWSAVQVREPVYKRAVGRWKSYEKHLGPLIDALGDLIK